QPCRALAAAQSRPCAFGCGAPRVASRAASAQPGVRGWFSRFPYSHKTRILSTSLDDKNSILLVVFRVFQVTLDRIARRWKRVDGGPCRDRTYDQEIKSLLLYQLS